MDDERGREVLLADAAAASRAWGCPRAGCAPVTLDDEHQRARSAVARLAGCDVADFPACPLAGTRTPEAHEAAALTRWMKNGALALRCPHPTPAQIDAIDAVMDSLAERESWELARAREKGGKRGE